MSEEKVIRRILCEGPGVPWDTLLPVDRLMWLLFKSGDYSVCGDQDVEIDLSSYEDPYPKDCPVCGTDMNWNHDQTMANINMIG